MEYSKIIAVSGLPGLFELVSSKTDGAIVRSLEDKSTKFVSNRVHQFSHLESIEIYTTRDNVNLVEILHAMKASSEKLPDEKDANALRKYFEQVYGDIDFERVYSSDLKKMVKWFSILDKNQIQIKLTEPVEEPEPETVAPEPVKEKKAKEKPAEKPAVAEKSKEKSKEKAKEKPATKEKAKEKAVPKAKPKAKSAEKEKDKPKKSASKKKSK